MDDETEEVFYFNRITKESLWYKPEDFDGYDIQTGQSHLQAQNWEKREKDLYKATFEVQGSVATSMEASKDQTKGQIGKWEVLD